MKLRYLLYLLLFISSLNATNGLAASAHDPHTSLPVVLQLNQIPQTSVIRQPAIAFPHDLDAAREKGAQRKHQKEFFIPQATLIEDKSAEISSDVNTKETQLTTSFQLFPGMNASGFNPADPILAAGPDHVVAAVNSSLAIYTKSGSKVFQTTFTAWFSSLPDSHGLGLFDPKVIYDQYSGHFIFLCAASGGPNHRSLYLFSVSQTSDPTGVWAFWTLDMQFNNKTHATVFADFPGLGYDEQAIYLTGNIFSLSPFQYAYAKIRVLKKSEVYAFNAITWHDFWNFIDATGAKAMNVQPAQSFGPGSNGYLLSTNALHGNKLTLYSVINPTGAPSLQKKAILVSSYRLPPNAPQRGGPLLINTGDDGVTNVVYANGQLYAANSISFDWGAGQVASIRFYDISTNGTVLQEITFGSRFSYYYYPVVMVDSQINIAIAMNQSSSRIFAGIFFTAQRATDPPGTLETIARIQAGQTYYDGLDPGNLDLWGDFNGIAVDQNDSIWIFSMYAKSLHAWATRGAVFHF